MVFASCSALVVSARACKYVLSGGRQPWRLLRSCFLSAPATDECVVRACVCVSERELRVAVCLSLPPGTAAAVTPTGRGFRRALVLSPSYIIMCVCVRRKKRREREKHERRATAVTVSFLGRAPSALHHCSSTSEGHLRIPTNGQSGVSYFQLGIRAQVTLISFYRSF